MMMVEQISASWRQVGVEGSSADSVSFAGLVSDFQAAMLRRRHRQLGHQRRSRSLSAVAQQPGRRGGQNYSGWINDQADELLVRTQRGGHREAQSASHRFPARSSWKKRRNFALLSGLHLRGQ
ncbi:MAG: hypothetical protein R2856_25600 [Caldilineaceae bacterium]